MLNALFGDPRVPLVRLHPMWGMTAAFVQGNARKNGPSGEKQVEDMIKYIQDKPLSDKVLKVDIEKIRKNSMSELVRFICQIEFPVNCSQINSDEHVYKAAYEMLLNGDIVSATRTLNKFGKSNLALCISCLLYTSDAADE